MSYILNKNRKQDQKSIRVSRVKIHLLPEAPALPDHSACTLPLLPVCDSVCMWGGGAVGIYTAMHHSKTSKDSYGYTTKKLELESGRNNTAQA